MLGNFSFAPNEVTFLATDVDSTTLNYVASTFTGTVNNGSNTTLTAAQQLTTAINARLQVSDGSLDSNLGPQVAFGTNASNNFAIITAGVSVAFWGFGGVDTLIGGTADDYLVGGAGNDALTGNAGSDTFVVDSGTDTVADLGNGADILVVSSLAIATVAVASIGFTATAATSNAGTANLTTNGFAVNLALASGPNGYSVTNSSTTGTTLIGSVFNDTLTGNSGNDILRGGVGTDSLVGGTGNDTYQFALADGTDAITDSSGTDTIQLLTGGVALTALNFSDSGTGNNQGNLVIAYQGQQITVNNHFNANNNVETISFANASYLGYQLGAGAYTLSQDDNGPRTAAAGINTVLTSDGGTPRTLTGNTGNDLLFGGAGNDTLDGGAGNDLLVGGAAFDSLTGGAGNNVLFGGADADDFIISAGTVDTILLTNISELGLGSDFNDQVTSLIQHNARAKNFTKILNNTDFS